MPKCEFSAIRFYIYFGMFYAVLSLEEKTMVTQQTFSCWKSKKETLEKGVKYVQSFYCHSGFFIVNFEHISCFFLVFLLLTLNN